MKRPDMGDRGSLLARCQSAKILEIGAIVNHVTVHFDRRIVLHIQIPSRLTREENRPRLVKTPPLEPLEHPLAICRYQNLESSSYGPKRIGLIQGPSVAE